MSSYIKRLIITSIILLVLILATIFIFFLYIDTDRSIYNITNSKEIKFVPWSLIESGILNTALSKKAELIESGILNTALSKKGIEIESDKKNPANKHAPPNLYYFSFEENVNAIDFVPNDMAFETYNLENNGFVTYPYVYKTAINQNEYGIIVQQWNSAISKKRFILYLFPLKVAETFGLSDYLNILSNSGDKITPVIRYNNNELCFSETNNDKEYCSWHMSKQTKILNLSKQWKSSGQIPFKFGNYPFRMQMQTINQKL